jgi:hypothetical protein
MENLDENKRSFTGWFVGRTEPILVRISGK